jgi:hypothetical protein
MKFISIPVAAQNIGLVAGLRAIIDLMDWHFWVPTGISLAAAAFSAASWWHNRTAHHERRTGELIRMGSDIFRRLTEVKERLGEADQALRSLRLQLRHLPESHPNKHDWIEAAPALAKDVEKHIERVNSIRLSMDRHPAHEHPSNILRAFHIAEHEIGELEVGTDKFTQIAERQTEAINQLTTQEKAEFDRLSRMALGETQIFESPKRSS